MAIISKLPVNSILWKYVKKEKHLRQDPERRYTYARDENGQYIKDDVDVYYYIRLYTRRARTNGCTVDEKLIPFLEKLRVRIDRGYRGNSHPIAVGCEVVRCRDKEEWDSVQLNEVAQRYYNRVKNIDMMKIIKHEKDISTKALDELKTLDLEEKPEPEQWPDEPYFYDQTPYWIRQGLY